MKIGKQTFNKGEGIKSLVYGGLDGTITTFAVVAGATGGALDMRVIIILGFANLLGDGISMAVGDYVSSKSEKEYAEHHKQEIETEYNEDQTAQMLEEKGLSAIDAHHFAETLSHYDAETRNNLLINDDEEESNPIINAIITFISFVIFGLFPLLIFIFAYFNHDLIPISFITSNILTFTTLFILGAVKTVVTKGNWFKSGLEMLIVGGLAAMAAYGIGVVLGGF